MSFTKGCYIGQEVLSRIKSTGKMPRELVAWQACEPEAPSPEAGHLLVDAEGREVGRVTSVTCHPLTGLAVGLGFVKQGFGVPDSVLLVAAVLPKMEASVQLLPLSHS